MDIVFQRNKQNSNRVKGVEVLSVLARVKNANSGFSQGLELRVRLDSWLG
jgi:hypothetical protein